MKVILSPRAEKQLKRFSKIDQISIANKIRSFKQTKPSNEEKLKGYKNIYRVRVGDYRIVYRRIKDEVYIIMIDDRKDIYDLIRRLFR